MVLNVAFLVKILQFVVSVIQSGHDAGLFDKDNHPAGAMIKDGFPNVDHPVVQDIMSLAEKHGPAV